MFAVRHVFVFPVFTLRHGIFDVYGVGAVTGRVPRASNLIIDDVSPMIPATQVAQRLGVQPAGDSFGDAFSAVYLIIVHIDGIGEVGFERQTLLAVRALETLPMEDDLVHRAYLLHLVDTLLASLAEFAFWGHKDVG